MSKINIKGVIPPMITPFTKTGEVDFDNFIRNIVKWNSDDIAGYLVLGSNSETPYLTKNEKLELIKLTVEHAKNDRIILAGTGMESTRATIDLTNEAAKLGAHAALILTPSFYKGKMNDQALINHFTEVANNSEIPILIYNVPKFTNINIPTNVLSILNELPNIVGMKDSSGSIQNIVTYLKVLTEDFNLIVGTASLWYPALTLGIKAGIMALSNLAPNELTNVQKKFESGKYTLAREIYLKMFPVNEAVTATYGIAGLKYAADLIGYAGGYVRSPLLPLKEVEKENLKEILSNAQLI